MNNNSTTLSSLYINTIYISALLCFSANATADITDKNAFLYGDNIEVGLGPDGAFGSDTNSLYGKSSGNKLGYISDPTGNNFQASYHGDFFLPGIPEEGWGVAFDDDPEKTYHNNSNQQGAEIFGGFSGYKSTIHGQKVVWKGFVKGLEITQVYRVYTEGTAVVFDVTLKNTTSTAMNNVYYMRTVDPDNNAEQDPSQGTSKYTTKNTILSQGSDGSGISAVSATQDAKPGLFTKSSLILSGYGANSRVTYGGTFNRNPSNVYNGTTLLRQSGTKIADDAVSLAFKFDKLEPGDTVTFRAGYQLKEVPVPSIDIDENDSSGESGNGFKQLYILGSTASNITDTDISITGDGFNQLQQAIITLTNPHSGDLLDISGELPARIIVDANESTDTEIRLKGLASKEDYQTILKQVVFSNSDTHSRIDTRIISIQVIDENATPSNAALSVVSITTPVVINNQITGDDIVNKNEVANVKLTGHAAPNASIKIDFTDKNGNKLTPAKTVTSDADGNWSIDADPADLSSLSDGLITVLVIAVDRNGNISTKVTEIQKDTIVLLNNITPIDNQVISSTTPIYSGKTDANANITLKVLPDGKVYSTAADANGDWSVQLDKFPIGVTSSVEITAEDEHSNQTSATLIFTTSNLAIEITDLDVDAQGIANSTTPTLKGTSEPNSSISIVMPTTDGNSITCNTTTDTNGKWACTLPVSPSGGPYTVTVTTTDGKGNTNSTSKQISIPELPLIIDSPTNNAVISDIKPLVAGTSKPATNVTVVASNGDSCTAVTDNTNHWSCQLPSLAFDQNYTLTITTKDSIGNSTTKAINISTDKLPLSITTPQDNTTTEDTTPTFIGTTAAGATITVTMDTGQTCSTTADSDGHWSCELPTLPVGGPYTATIKAVDSDGNQMNTTLTFTTPNLPIEITDLDVDSQGVASSTTPTLKGTSEPNTSISIIMPTTDGSSITCNTTTDTNGKWACTLPVSPSGGPYTVTVTTTDGKGNTNSTNKQISIPELPLIIDSPVNDAVISGINPLVSGTSKPATNVIVVASNGDSCTAVTDDKNHWSCQLPSLAFGQNYTLTVTTKDSIDNSTTKAVNISTDKLPLSITTPQDNTTTEDTTPTFIGTTAAGTTVTVTMETGQTCSATADSDGRWSCELPALPVGGPYTATIKAVDSYGNQTLITENIKVPAIPLIISSPSEGEVVTSGGITVTGSSDPNTPIKVLGPDGESCETTSDASGAWSCQLDNLQSGAGKHITVISGEGTNGKKVAITNINIENSSEKVKTILAGSTSLLTILFLLGLLFLLKLNYKLSPSRVVAQKSQIKTVIK